VEVGVTTYGTVPETELLGFVSVWLMVAPEPALEPVIPPVIVPIVHAKLLATLDVRAMFGLIPLHALTEAVFVTTGIGSTVTVTVVAAPAHEPEVDVGVTRYSILPELALLGLVKVWLIAVPELAVAPLMVPTLFPRVQLKLLAALAVSAILGLVPLHTVAVVALVRAGRGFTVTVIVDAGPTHEPDMDVGVTWYCTEPEEALLGLLSVWEIEAPELALEPVIAPVMVPMVQL
jgi:hypothetical protein